MTLPNLSGLSKDSYETAEQKAVGGKYFAPLALTLVLLAGHRVGHHLHLRRIRQANRVCR
jgi:hypothetical protein